MIIVLVLQFKGIWCILEERPRTTSGGEHIHRNVYFIIQWCLKLVQPGNPFSSSCYGSCLYKLLSACFISQLKIKTSKCEVSDGCSWKYLALNSFCKLFQQFPLCSKRLVWFLYCYEGAALILSVQSQALDYSDDEKEQQAKRKVKNSKKKRDNNGTGMCTREQEIYSEWRESLTCLDVCWSRYHLTEV